MLDDNCLFCKIIKGDIPSFKIYETDNFLAFLDISQFTEGHTIIIPKQHYPFLWDVPEAAEYMEVIQKVGNHFRKLGYQYVDTMSFGRDVPHSHVHLIPHNNEISDYKSALENIGNMQRDPGRRPSREKGEEIAKKFRL